MSTHPLLRPSDRVASIAHINPQSATTVQVSAWVLISLYENLLAKFCVGTLASTATVDAKVEQATSSGGAGAKTVTGMTITQLTEAGTDSNKQALVNIRAQDFDFNNGFVYARISMTPATAAALIFGELLGFDGNYPVVHATTVDEVV